MSKPRILGAPMGEDQVAIIDALKDALALAIEGKIRTIGVLVCFEEGFASGMAGHDAGALNLACDDLKYKIHKAVTAGSDERQSRRSSIIKPLQ